MPAGNDLDRLRRLVDLRDAMRPVIRAGREDLRLEALSGRAADAPLCLTRRVFRRLLGVEKLQRLFIRCGIQLARRLLLIARRQTVHADAHCNCSFLCGVFDLVILLPRPAAQLMPAALILRPIVKAI